MAALFLLSWLSRQSIAVHVFGRIGLAGGVLAGIIGFFQVGFKSFREKKPHVVHRTASVVCRCLHQQCQAIGQSVGERALLHNISKIAGSNISLEPIIETVLESTLRETQAVWGFILLDERQSEDQPRKLRWRASRGAPVDDFSRLAVFEELLNYVTEHDRPLRLTKDRNRLKLLSRGKLMDVICAPITGVDSTLGVMGLINKQAGNFNEKDLRVLMTSADEASGAVYNARLFSGLPERCFSTVQALSGAIDAKDPYARGHNARVAKYSQIIAQALGCSEADMEIIRIAAYLHDIGKIGVHEQILQKCAKLTASEYALVKRHSAVSAKILAGASFLQQIISIVRHHHERFDGTGYPDGLAQADIPFGAGIIAVADAFDAMTSHRPYRQALDRRAALSEISRCAGDQFDPRIVEAFKNQILTVPDAPPILAGAKCRILKAAVGKDSGADGFPVAGYGVFSAPMIK